MPLLSNASLCDGKRNSVHTNARSVSSPYLHRASHTQMHLSPMQHARSPQPALGGRKDASSNDLGTSSKSRVGMLLCSTRSPTSCIVRWLLASRLNIGWSLRNSDSAFSCSLYTSSASGLELCCSMLAGLSSVDVDGI